MAGKCTTCGLNDHVFWVHNNSIKLLIDRFKGKKGIGLKRDMYFCADCYGVFHESVIMSSKKGKGDKYLLVNSDYIAGAGFIADSMVANAIKKPIFIIACHGTDLSYVNAFLKVEIASVAWYSNKKELDVLLKAAREKDAYFINA